MEQSFDDFNEELQSNLVSFKEHWLKQNKKDPTCYPMSMLSGDWFEQFLIFIEEIKHEN